MLKRIVVDIPETVKAKFKRVVKIKGKTVTGVLRDYISAYIDIYKKDTK